MASRRSIAAISDAAGDKSWKQRQEKVFTNWINMKLKKHPTFEGRVCLTDGSDLYEDLSDGYILYHLLEVLSGQSLRPLGKLTKGKMRIQKVSNMNIVWKYIEQTVKTVNIGPMDVVDGEQKIVLGLLWSIIVFFMIKDLGGMDDVAALKKKVMKWVKKKTAGHDDIDITDLTTSFADGKAFLAILNNIDPAGSPYNPSEDRLENVQNAFKDMDEKFGIPCLIDPTDEDFWEDEKAMLTQLGALMNQLPEMVEQPKHPIDDWLDGEGGMPKVKDDLSDLCAIPSIPEDPDHISDCDAAAAKVKDMMTDSGMDDVFVDNESGGPPFVVGIKDSDASKPTVLLYSNYTVSSPDDPAGGTWDGNPFDPIKDGDEGEGSVKAKGVAEDKANIVAPLAAVKAIMDTLGDGDLPVNVKVVVGGIPPPTHAAYDPTNSTQKMKDFCERNKDKLMPDFVLVSEPDGSLLAPNAAAGMFSCRGFCSFDVTASTFDAPAGEDTFCSRWVGPCVDPALALLQAVGSLRDETGQIAVDGMDAFPVNEAIVNAVKAIPCTESDLRAAAGYKPGVAVAPTPGASLAEMLCFYPGVSVVNQSVSSSAVSEATVPSTATLRVHANLPPAQPVADATEKIQAHIMANLPYGVSCSFTNAKGEPGWLSDPEHDFYKTTCKAMATQHAPRQAVSNGNPEYKPIPATFANVFGKPTYMHGVNDPSRKIGHANEEVQMDDVKREIKSFIQTLAGIGDMDLQGMPGPGEGDGAVAITAPVEAGSAEAEAEAPASKKVGGSTLAPPPAAAAAEAPAAPPAAPPAPPAAEPVALDEEVNLDASEEKSVPDGDSGSHLRLARSMSLSAPSNKEIEACFKEINAVRLDPAGYATKMEALVSAFSEVEGQKVFTDPEDQRMIATHEGVDALQDCITALKGMSPSGPLLWKEGVAAAAADHAMFLGLGNTGHVGKDGTRAADRLSVYGTWLELCGEVIAYRERSAEAIVRQMLLCDGEKTRTDRKTLLDPMMKVCGISSADHPSLDAVVVVNLSCGFFGAPHPTEMKVEQAGGEPEGDFKVILESIPVLQVNEEINTALAAGSAVSIDYTPGGKATYVITTDGTAATKFIEWGAQAQS